MDRKVCDDAQLKILGSADGPGILSGYASTFGNWDRQDERPVKGAFTPYLAPFLTDGFISAYHQWAALPVATIQDAHEDDHGLWFTAEFHSTPFAQDVRTTTAERLARGKSAKTSIGYEVLADEYVPEGRLLKAVSLFEIAVVNVPANPLADVTGVKSLPFDEHSATALATVREFLHRAGDLAALRAKEGRTLSTANVAKLRTLRDALDAHQAGMTEMCGMLDELLAPFADAGPVPPAKAVDPSLIYLEVARALALDAARLGVPVHAYPR